MARYARILATGRCVPERRVTNAEVESRLGVPVDKWLVDNVGIHARHFMDDDEATSDLATRAARQALERAGVRPDAVDLIIVATDTPDQPSPATASVVQAKLGAANAGTYDVNCACAGWVTALDIAAKTLIADPGYTNVLVIGAYGMSRFIDWTDKTTCTLFADGAGAALLTVGDKPGFLGAALSADGSFADALGIYGGGTRRPSTRENVETFGPPSVKFVRKFPATFNRDHWPPLIDKALGKAGLGREDIDLFLFTQLNLRLIEAMMDELRLPLARAHWIMDKWGYTGSACIPMALDDAVERGRLKAGDRVLFCASGGGIAMAVAVFEWSIG